MTFNDQMTFRCLTEEMNENEDQFIFAIFPESK